MTKKPDITLYFLGASRGIRIAWLLEELGLDYELVSSPRDKQTGVAPPEFKKKIPNPLGKSPTIKDGEIVVTESSAIVEYLVEHYDPSHRLLPLDPNLRAQCREWMTAAEGTFMLHAMAILYARWKIPESARSHLPEMEKNLTPNVLNDFNWLEGALQEQKAKGNKWLIGDGEDVTAADVMMQFSVQFIFERNLGVRESLEAGKWPEVQAWLARAMATNTFKRAVEKTGYTLDGDFKK